MRAFHASLRAALCVIFAFIAGSRAAGLEQRVANTTLQMPASPATFGFASTNAFGNLLFTNPVCITSPPGETNRLFVLEKRGRIVAITNLAAPTRTIFMDITSRVVSGGDTDVGNEQGLLGMAFHPGYATNRYFYLFYTTTGTRRDRLSRFEISPTDPNQGMINPEVVLIDQVDEAGNHNGGDLHFGPDGYLYVSLGDEGGGNDQFNNSQTITKDFFAGILRIDVDKRPGNLAPNAHAAATTNYAVPADNPFVGATNFNGATVNPAQVRTEYWAVGLRNPWRMSFDPVTGWLYCGDVGQNQREEIDIIVRGGNYGWAYREGIIAGPKAAPPGFTSINPILDYSHSEGISVTGGVVYRGNRISQLFGAYVFGDYGGGGRVWATRYNGTNTTPRQLLLSDTGISAFGVDPSNGDVLYADLALGTNSTIDRIIYNSTVTGAPLPATLADTGAFSDLASLAPQAGIVPYDLNVPFWSDHAIKTRWFSVPDTNLMIGFNRDGNWSFPTGAVWVKHFELELTNGVPASRKRLETRFIVRNAGGVYGVTYRWGNSLTNATLVGEEGLDEEFLIHDGGTVRTQVWRYPSRSECLQCHTAVAGHALGFNTTQLNREFDYGAGAENQIAALNRVGYFSSPVSNHFTLSALAPRTNDAYSLEYRVRSYLAANCIQCHQPGGPSQGLWDARLTTPISQAAIIQGDLINNGGDSNNHVVTPGSPANSMLLTRISTRGPGQMPPIASNVLDTNAIALVTAWITNGLANYQSFTAWQTANFGSTNAPNAAPNADPDTDGANNTLEYLTGTNPLQGGNAWDVAARPSGNTIEITFDQIANRGFEVQWADVLSSPVLWRTLDTPANRPFISATNFTATVTDTFSNSPAKYYRVRVFEP
ncbi:MAG TPA: PQQ-dependent sugar dehydrogenase [Verrucomicrobiae bacterium]|nr:PQQ-dependent sugar dehydrogenase [Verrucomicrobiae bacterium]